MVLLKKHVVLLKALDSSFPPQELQLLYQQREDSNNQHICVADVTHVKITDAK